MKLCMCESVCIHSMYICMCMYTSIHMLKCAYYTCSPYHTCILPISLFCCLDAHPASLLPGDHEDSETRSTDHHLPSSG